MKSIEAQDGIDLKNKMLKWKNKQIGNAINKYQIDEAYSTSKNDEF